MEYEHPYPVGTPVTFSIEDIFDIDGTIYDTVGAPTSEVPDRNFLEDGWYFVQSETGLYEVNIDLIRPRIITTKTIP
jgi:hypothetical protein